MGKGMTGHVMGEDPVKPNTNSDVVLDLEAGEIKPLLSAGNGSREKKRGMTLAWSDVGYTVKVKDSSTPFYKREKFDKTVLSGVSGYVKEGQMLAIMGSSGAGKSTLLDILAGREKAGQLTGAVRANGRDTRSAKVSNWFRRNSAYVCQDENLNGASRVREALQFYVDLKLPSSISKVEKRRRVEQIISELSLEKVADSYIGTQYKRGISGGEKKRVSIGCELIEDPSLLFLDEPTTGLDAYNSQMVMNSLRNLTQSGRTVVCTLHQPRSSVFDMFDQLMVLSQGRVAYFGPAKAAVDYFSRLNFSCGRFQNPADFLIDVTVENMAVHSREKSDQLDQLMLMNDLEKHQSVNVIESWHCSAEQTSVVKEVEQLSMMVDGTIEEQKHVSQYASTWYFQVYALTKRAWHNTIRNPIATYSSFGQTVFMALVIGSIYWQIGLSQASIQDRLGVLFFMIMNSAFGQMFALNELISERNMINRERAGNAYCTSAYFVAKNLIQIPLSMIPPILFSCISYWMVGLYPGTEQFFTFMLAMIAFTLAATSFFLLIGAISPSMEVAQIIAPVLLVFLILFGGFYINIDSIPVYYVWIQYISFVRYGFQLVVVNEFSPISSFDCSSSISVCVPNGEAELELLGMANVTLWEQFVALAITFVVARALSYLAMRFMHKEKR